MPRLRPRQSLNFTKTEIDEMEDLYKELGEKTLCQNFCEKLAKKFSLHPLNVAIDWSCSRDTDRSTKPSIQWNQVKAWFVKKQQICKPEVVVIDEEPAVISPKKPSVAPPNVAISNNTCEIFAAPKVEDEKHQDISDLEFEALSLRDGAWYDVAFFLTHRVLSTGESEVRVRFAGFGSEEDEWVNMKTGVRERSLPLESSECHKVNVGDLVLCFQVNEDQELYYDAHVLEIERKLHDIRGCRCIFLVRYDHDSTEERVQLRRLCRRPHIRTSEQI